MQFSHVQNFLSSGTALLPACSIKRLGEQTHASLPSGFLTVPGQKHTALNQNAMDVANHCPTIPSSIAFSAVDIADVFELIHPIARNYPH